MESENSAVCNTIDCTEEVLMKRKYLKQVVFLTAFAVGIAAFSQGNIVYATEISESDNADTKSDHADKQESAITNYPEYDEIIRKYHEGIAAGWSMEDFTENNLCYLAGYEMGENTLGYCTMDINGDGIDELMIGAVGKEADTGMFYDLYTIVDGQRSLVVSSGERDRYYLCEDYTIANEGSGGALSSVFGYYDLISDQLQLKEGVFLNGNDYPDNPWFYTVTDIYGDYSTPITESEGRDIINKYPYMTIPYIPLDEMNSQDNIENSDTGDNAAEQPKTDEAADASIAENNATTENKEAEVTGIHHVEIEIRDYGTLKVELDADTAPITVANFMKLTKEGFYDGLTFWRIMDGFMIQGGDPEGDGTGGSKETIKGEFSNNGVENNISHTRGTISMARASDPDSGSSQFFIVQTDSTFLDGEYAAFGHVTEGMEIVDEICKDANPIDDNGTIEADEQPVIESIRIID